MVKMQTFLSQMSETSSARLSEIAFSLQTATSSKFSAARFFQFKPIYPFSVRFCWTAGLATYLEISSQFSRPIGQIEFFSWLARALLWGEGNSSILTIIGSSVTKMFLIYVFLKKPKVMVLINKYFTKHLSLQDSVPFLL